MGKAQEIIKKHVGNPAGLLGLLDDMVYVEATHQLGGLLFEAARKEQFYSGSIVDDKARKFALMEVERLRALADELMTVAHPTGAEMEKVINERYMIGPPVKILDATSEEEVRGV